MSGLGRPPHLTGVLETALYVAELDAAERWYRALFGFEVMLSDHRLRALGVPGGQVLLLFRKGGSTEPSPTPGGVIPPHDSSGRQHVCFAVPVQALPAWQARLAQLGIDIESRVSFPNGGTSLYFRDPDGHSLELATPGLWPNY